MEIKSKYFKHTMNKQILSYINQLEPPVDIELPGKNTRWLYPFNNPETYRCMETFYSKYYSDTNQRILILGINPGRFGSAITGVPLTDPIRLKTACKIDSSFPLKPELSSQFIYDYFFNEYSMEKFFSKFFIGAVCPLGLESNGRNMNYYDNKNLMNNLLEHFIPDNIENQINIGCSKKVVICLGEVSHPRYIMQYKRKSINDYVKQYIDACELAQKLV